MKKILFASACLFSLFTIPNVQAQAKPASSPQVVSNKINWLKNYSDAVEQSNLSGKPIIILFTGTNWCPACMKLEQQVLTKPEFAKGVGNAFVFLKAEFPEYDEASIEKSPYKPLMDRYRVELFPTIVMVDANGQLIDTIDYQAGGPNVYINQMLQKKNKR